jgi:hypothetical protein
MARKRHTAEEIVAKLRQVDVLTAQGRRMNAGEISALGAPRLPAGRLAARHAVTRRSFVPTWMH